MEIKNQTFEDLEYVMIKEIIDGSERTHEGLLLGSKTNNDTVFLYLLEQSNRTPLTLKLKHYNIISIEKLTQEDLVMFIHDDLALKALDSLRQKKAIAKAKRLAGLKNA